MKTATKGSSKKSVQPSENSFARKALEEIQRIEEEAKQQKLAQLDSLNSARAAIGERIEELNHQLKQLETAMSAITGRPAPSKERVERRDWSETRERVATWMESRRGQKFAAGDVVREFSELDGQPISIFLRPLIEAGRLRTDSSEGPRRTKYFVEG